MAKDKAFDEILRAEIGIMCKIAQLGINPNEPLLHILDYNIDQGIICTDKNEMMTTELSYIVTEYAAFGDLATDIVNERSSYLNGQDEGKLFSFIFEQLIEGVEAIHNRGFVHLDLKPDNILMMDKTKVVISDYALSRPIKGEDGKGNFIKYRAGSKSYWSPEMFTGFPYNGVESDIYALGIILFILVFGSCPFLQANVEDTHFRLLVKNPVEFWKMHPETNRRIEENSVSPEVIQLLNFMLCPYPQYRLSIAKIKEQPWYMNNKKTEIIPIFGQNFGNISNDCTPVIEETLMSNLATHDEFTTEGKECSKF